MADHTKIEWTDATWNPVRGCSRVSDGCRHCYAERVAARFCGTGQPYEGLIHPSTGGWNGTVKLVPEALQIPWRWTRPRRIFVNSMSDLFHEDVPFEFIAAVFYIMGHTTRHTYQVLTKRPARMLAFFEWLATRDKVDFIDLIMDLDERDGRGRFSSDVTKYVMMHALSEAAYTVDALKALGWEPSRGGRGGYDNCGPSWPYENVWLGVSVEDQAAADERIPLLLRCPAAVRWISAEPLLGLVDLDTFFWERLPPDELSDDGPIGLEGTEPQLTVPRRLPGIDWLVAGGESGPSARPANPQWFRDLRDQCAAAGVPFLFKQWGDWVSVSEVAGAGDHHTFPDGRTVRRTGKKAAGRTLDGRLHDEYPVVRRG